MIVIPKYPCYISNANYLCPENATDSSAAVSQDAPAVLEKQGEGAHSAMIRLKIQHLEWCRSLIISLL